MLSHIDDRNRPAMVDVSGKEITYRQATACSVVMLPENILKLFSGGEITTKKGPVFQTAIIAGSMAVKKTAELIPFCHTLPIESCSITIELNDKKEVVIHCTVAAHHKTGVEMEALTGASIAALTLYDMCKSMSHQIQIANTFLVKKTGGKSSPSQ